MTRRGRKKGNGEEKSEKEQGIPQAASFDEGFSMWGAFRCSFFREVRLVFEDNIGGPLRDLRWIPSGRSMGSFIRKYYELTR